MNGSMPNWFMDNFDIELCCVELETKVREVFTIMEKAPTTREFSLLKEPTSTSTLKNLLKTLC